MPATTSWLTEALIRQHAAGDSFQRGQEYQRAGAVVSLVRRGDVLQAEVEGSEPAPYIVLVELDGGGIKTALCSCPDTRWSWCKHIVAALLTCIHEPENVAERPPLETLLADLDRNQLQTVLLRLAERDPLLAEAIDSQVTIIRTATPTAPPDAATGPRPRHTAIDTPAIRREVRSALHSLDRMSGTAAYYAVGGVIGQIRQPVSQAWEFTRAGDGRTALAILEAVTDAYTKEWETLDGSDGESGDFLAELGTALTEAILTADLTRTERDAWARKVRAWEEEVSDYGIDDAFTAAAAAAEQGWDDPALVRALQGEITEHGAWEGEEPFCADELAAARLNVLERQGRFEEYLNLAEAEGQTDRRATMLATLGRTQEAVEAGLRELNAAGEALDLAQALRAQGEIEAALQVAEHGLTLQGPRAPLATWLCDLATAAGQTGRALEAGLVALREAPDLAAYARVQELAGEEWPRRREEILERLRGVHSYYPQAQVDIFLHEGLVDDAIAAVDDGASRTVVEQVVDAALQSRPDWAIAACRRQAEGIMDGGKAEYYSAAAQWLAKARDAYRATGRQDEWRSYLEEQITRHQRKYKLRPMLEALRK